MFEEVCMIVRRKRNWRDCNGLKIVEIIYGPVVEVGLGYDRGSGDAGIFLLGALGGGEAFIEARRRAPLAHQPDLAMAHSLFQVRDQTVVVADPQRGAGPVDRAVDLFQAEDFEVQVEIPRMNPHGPQQALEVFGFVDALLESHDHAARQFSGALFERDDLADDDFRGVAPPVDGAFDPADRFALDQRGHLGKFLGPEHCGGRAA